MIHTARGGSRAWTSSSSEPAACGAGARLRHPAAGRKRCEHRLYQRDRLALAADHQAVPLIEAEDAAAGTDVEITDASRLELLCPADVIVIVGIAAVDEHVAGCQQRSQLPDHRVDDRCRHHDPHRARRLEGAYQLLE